ncbi:MULTISPECIES: hypothetical protein [unclassified Mesorhizobium]|uniref:hypothetical protein n=1 Tax=unclassified Mesorhizobium TaxID=325217 RepID=UPI0012694459|nr:MULTISPECIES: hypothetical protein [unclassified Mesorhizobium]
MAIHRIQKWAKRMSAAGTDDKRFPSGTTGKARAWAFFSAVDEHRHNCRGAVTIPDTTMMQLTKSRSAWPHYDHQVGLRLPVPGVTQWRQPFSCASRSAQRNPHPADRIASGLVRRSKTYAAKSLASSTIVRVVDAEKIALVKTWEG